MDMHRTELPTVPTRKATIDCRGRRRGGSTSAPTASRYRHVQWSSVLNLDIREQ